jgi:hypothetical protein
LESLRKTVLAVCLTGAVLAQPRLEFEVASIKPAVGDRNFMGTQGGPGTSDPGRLTETNVTLIDLLSRRIA